MIIKNLIVVLVLGVLGFGVFAIVSNKVSGLDKLPEEAQRNEMVKEAYLFARDNKELLEKIPCFCGCVNMGHRHNRDCYIDDNNEYVEHGALCGGCLEVTLDVKKLLEEGKNDREIREFIDEKYSNREMSDPTLTPFFE